MDVILSKKDLLRLFRRTQGVVDKKSTMPILSNVLVRASDGVLRVAATDLFMAVTASIKAEVKSNGVLAIPGKDLVERLSVMPEGPVQISASEGTTAQIKAVGARREFRLRGMAGEDFPAIPHADADAASLEIAPAVLADLMAKTHFSISTDETRPHLNSALLEWEGETIRMVTTDGHRLSKHEVHVTGGATTKMSILIPNKGITELRKLCDELKSDKEPGAITLTRSGPNVFFKTSRDGEEAILAVKLVDSQFPPYQQVIPQRSEINVRVGRLQLAETLNAMKVAAAEKTGSVKLTLGKGVLRVTSEDPESGAGVDEIPIDYAGSELTIGFNVKYLLDVLGALPDDEVKIGMTGELDPVVVEPASDTKFLGIVMPMRI